MSDGLTLLHRSLPRPMRLGRITIWLALECLPAFAAGYVVARVTEALVASRPWQTVAWLGCLAVTILIGAQSTRRVYSLIGPVVEGLRDNLMTAVVCGTIAECATTGRPGMSTVTQTVEHVDQVRNLVSAVLRSIRSTVGPVLSATAGMLLLDARLGIAVALPMVAALVGQTLLVRAAVGRQRSVALAKETFGADATAVLSELPALRGLGADKWGRERLTVAAADVAAAERRALRTVTARRAVVVVGTHVPLLSVLMVAAPLLRSGAVSAGTVLGAATYVLTILGPALVALAGVSGGWLVELIIALERLARVTSHSNPPPSAPATAPTMNGVAIELQHLTFRYRTGSRPLLDGFDLTVTAGTALVVLGASGSGKSTLARLISGLQAPTSGSVMVDGSLCYVPQESYVFAGSLRDNLLYLAASSVSEAVVSEALRTFGLDDIVEQVGGLDAELASRDERLTGADRQRLVLARAWLSSADVVILDEATSLLDVDQQMSLLEMFRGNGRTLVVIAHHLTLAHSAGQVVWFDGADAFAGTHDQLLRDLPSYADLHAHALSYT